MPAAKRVRVSARGLRVCRRGQRTDAGGHAAEDAHRKRHTEAAECEIHADATERRAAVEFHVRVYDSNGPLAEGVADDAAAGAGDASGDKSRHERKTRADRVLGTNDAKGTKAERIAPEHGGTVLLNAGGRRHLSPQEKCCEGGEDRNP